MQVDSEDRRMLKEKCPLLDALLDAHIKHETFEPSQCLGGEATAKRALGQAIDLTNRVAREVLRAIADAYEDS